MKPTVKKLFDEAQSLSAKQQRQLADQLYKGLPLFEDPEIAAEWSEEIKRRVEEIKSGEAELVSWEDVEKSLKRSNNGARRAHHSSARAKRY